MKRTIVHLQLQQQYPANYVTDVTLNLSLRSQRLLTAILQLNSKYNNDMAAEVILNIQISFTSSPTDTMYVTSPSIAMQDVKNKLYLH